MRPRPRRRLQIEAATHCCASGLARGDEMPELSILLAVSAGETAKRLTKVLEGEGFRADALALGSELPAALGARDYDLVLLSDDLPDAGTHELLLHILDRSADLPVVVVAQTPSVRDAVASMKQGATHYLGASEPAAEFLDVVSSALRAKLEALEEEERRRERQIASLVDLRSVEVINSIMERHGFRASRLVGVLQDIQQELRYLPQDALRHVSERLGVPLSRVYSVATFYQAFSLMPRGKHIVKVCMGTACHVRGAPRVLEELERKLGVGPGETTYDMEYTLMTVNCLGCCALGPVVVVDGEYHSVKPWNVDAVLGLEDRGQPPAKAEAPAGAEREAAA